jgi:outer membrane scaffolding protein for murein synthesis (MipA/OmpV family)
MRLPQGLDFGVQAGPIWNDRRLNEHTYGVAPVYATAARPAYSAGGGYAGWQATLGVSRRVGRLWMGAFMRADSVAGAVFEDSPLVRRRQQAAYGLAMSWVFATSSERVASEE